ncbi:ParB N-terminal domain-containing protein [Mesorhizobium sp. M0152]|uniref:ParB/Srx family N-terminal domain-containing protein n=1 Tax=Mesorhizobium sp. M0152 TaxID=2956898 RepID=UPI003338CDC6
MKNHVQGTAIVADLVPYARNPRTHSADQVAKLCASIREFGFTNPVLIDEEGSIVAGHGRIMAANRLGMKEVPCVTLKGLSDAQKKALIIADNRLAEDAGWNDELLVGLLHDLNADGYDLELTGFSDDEIEDFLRPSGDDDLDIGSEAGEGASGTDKEYLVFGAFRVPITEDEVKRLSKAVERYVEENGAAYGFPAFLLDGAGA